MKKAKIAAGVFLILLGVILNYKIIALVFFRYGPAFRKAVKCFITLADLGLITWGSFLIYARNKKITSKEGGIFLFNAVIFFLIPYIAMEGVVVKSNIIHPPRFKERRRLFYEFLEPDKDMGYKIKPNLKNFEIEWLEGTSAIYETDELGFRNAGNKKNAAIAVVGDSVAFAVGVNYEKAWFNILSGELGLDIADYAVGGYHPWQYNWLIRKFVANLPHRIVFYCIFANDLSNHHRIIKNSYRYYEYMGWDDYKSGYPGLKRTVTYTALKKFGQAIDRLFRYQKERHRLDNGLYLYRVTGAEADYLKRGTDLLTEHFLREAISLSENKELVVILFPSKESVYREEYINAFDDSGRDYIENEIEGYRRIIRFCGEKGILAYDLTDGLRNMKNDEVLFFNEDPHLNARGNIEAARLISKKFREWENKGLVRR